MRRDRIHHIVHLAQAAVGQVRRTDHRSRQRQDRTYRQGLHAGGT
jgi:hypothetical protein